MIDLYSERGNAFPPSRRSRQPGEGWEIVPWSELARDADVYEGTGKVRTGLFVANNPVNWIDPLGLAPGDLWDPRTYAEAVFGSPEALYTGNAFSTDAEYQAALNAAARYVHCHGGVRGVSAGVGRNFGSGNVRFNLSGGGNWTIDNGFGLQGSAGVNFRSGATSATYGVGGAWNQGAGGTVRGGLSLSNSGVRSSTGISDGGIGNFNLGLRFGNVANAGLVIDPNRVLQNFRDTWDVLNGRGGGDDDCGCR